MQAEPKWRLVGSPLSTLWSEGGGRGAGAQAPGDTLLQSPCP